MKTSALSPTLFTLSRLPPVSAATAGAIRAMSLRRAGLLRSREILIAPFGRITLTCIDIGEPPPARPDCEWWSVFRVRGSESPGALVLDGLTALRLMYSSLGLPGPRIFRSLGQSERGIAAATLASLVRSFSGELALSLHRPTHRLRDDLVRLTIAMEFDRFREYIHLLVPPDWFPEGGGPRVVDEARRLDLKIPLALELGRTDLALVEWANAERGDAIVFDVVPYPRDVERTVYLSCGAFACAAQLSAHGKVVLTSQFEAIEPSPPPVVVPPSPPPERTVMPTPTESRSFRAEAVLAAAPIELIAEIGRLSLPAEDVLALAPGSVLAIGPLNPQLVDLRIGSRLWARGELVDVEGRLGVRLTTITADRRSTSEP